MIDGLLIVVVAIVTWCVASEGAFGAGLTLLCVIFSGLLAMNFFEPLANLLSNQGSAIAPYADIVALLGLFTAFTFLLRLGTEQIAPTQIEIDGRVYQAARWLLALATGYVSMAILLTALHTAPLPREFIGFRPERNNLFGAAAPDRQWLGFTQHVSEKILCRMERVASRNRNEPPQLRARVFDGPQFAPPGSTKQEVWPSFPIRYAVRREQYAKGGSAAPARITRGAARPQAPAGSGPAPDQGF